MTDRGCPPPRDYRDALARRAKRKARESSESGRSGTGGWQAPVAVKGGQGRTDSEVREHGIAVSYALLLAVTVAAVFASGWVVVRLLGAVR